MVDDTRSGRHRTAARYNPVAELSTIVKSAGETSVKASAVLAASGGLVAAFALPAQAAPAGAPRGEQHHDDGRRGARRRGEHVTTAPDRARARPGRGRPRGGRTGRRRQGRRRRRQGRRQAEAQAEGRPGGARRREPLRASSGPASRSSTRYSNLAQSSSEVVNIARGLLGIPYVYGGESPSGFDCSGFTPYVFGKAGISIPRTASAQQRAATPVSNPQPGDLVFFGSPAWHVGIYTGNGMMIDSPRPGKSTSERPIFSGVSGYGRF